MRLDCACCKDMFIGDPFEELFSSQAMKYGSYTGDKSFPKTWIFMESQCVLAIGFKSDLPKVLERLGLFAPIFSYSGPWVTTQKLEYSCYNLQWLELIVTSLEGNGKLFPWYKGALIFLGDNFFGILSPKITEEDYNG